MEFWNTSLSRLRYMAQKDSKLETMEHHKNVTKKDDTFPRRNANSSEGQLASEHLLDRLHLHGHHKTDNHIKALQGYLETRKANKEALELLKQKIFYDNLKRRERQQTKRGTLFQSEILQRNLSEEFSDKKLPLAPKQDIKKSPSKCPFLTVTPATNSITFSVASAPRTRADTLPLSQRGTKRDLGGVTVTQDDVTPMQATGTVMPLQCRPKNSKLDDCDLPVGNKCILKKTATEKDAENTKQEQDGKTTGKWFRSSLFPPIPQKVNFIVSSNEKDFTGEDSNSSKQPKEPTDNTEDQESQDSFLQSSTSFWQEESEQLTTKIKKFVAKPNPTPPPSSLKIRRSTIHNINVQSYSKRNKDPVQGGERKKVFGVVNIHTCPNVNVYKDRSWMYQDRLGEKCRYIREPPSPIPPIEYVFNQNDSR